MKFVKRILLNTLLIGIFSLAAFGKTQQCPKIELVLPSGLINPEETATIVAKIIAVPDIRNLSYSWTVSSGKIISGQGSGEIEFATNEDDEGKNIKVAVKVLGLPKDCPSTAEDLMPIAQLPIGEPVDEIGNLKPNDFRGRLDTYFAQLIYNPESKGLIEVVIDERNKGKKRTAQLGLILKHIEFRQFDKSRITLAITTDKLQKAVFWTVPPGAKLPHTRSNKDGRISSDTHHLVKVEEFDQNLLNTFLKQN